MTLLSLIEVQYRGILLSSLKSIGLEILREEELVWSDPPSCQRQWKISKLKTEIKHK